MHGYCEGSLQHPRSAGWNATAAASGAFTVGGSAGAADLADFLHDHRPNGSLTADATEPAWNGYPLNVTCPCGVVLESEEENLTLCLSGEKTGSLPTSTREAASDRAILHVWTSVGMWTRCE